MLPVQFSLHKQPLRKTQSQKVGNENAFQRTRMDIKFEDLFDKITQVTDDWHNYVKGPLNPSSQNTSVVLRRMPTTETTLNPEIEPLRIMRRLPLTHYNSNHSAEKLYRSPRQITVTDTKSPRTVGIQDFILGKSLGSGKFGEVYKCFHKETGTIYALKKLIKGTLREYNMIGQLSQELRIHSRVDHPNITKMYTHFHDDYHVFALMEYIDGGELMDYRKRGEAFTSKVIHQVLQAVQHLHRNKIAHRDIKPENILMCNGLVKLCDFGWAANCENGMRKTFCGTMDYVSPQVLDQKEYYLQVDLWSVGILAFEMIAGFAPFSKQTPRFKLDQFTRTQKLNIVFPPTFTDTAKDFIQKLLRKNPGQRLPIQQCYSHQFISRHMDKKPLSNVEPFV